MDKDFRELLSVLNARNVRYLVIGGYAISFHTEPRATKDLDLFIKSDPENARVVFEALCEFGAPMSGATIQDFADGVTTYQIGVPPFRIDIIQAIDGIDFETAWKNRVVGEADPDDPMQVNYMSALDLIQNKIASGRHQDLADVEKIQASLRANKKQ